MSDHCTNCGKEYHNKPHTGPQWWMLKGYHNVSGFFCNKCYDLVSHDPYGKPKNYEAWVAIAVKQRLQRAVKRGDQ